MIALLIAVGMSAAHAASPAAALTLCKPRLARRVDGDISSIETASVMRRGSSTTLSGPMRALIGMGDPAPGMASTHHLIRQDYRFSCTVRGNRVTKVSVKPVP